jgi:hypothetical protein
MNHDLGAACANDPERLSQVEILGQPILVAPLSTSYRRRGAVCDGLGFGTIPGVLTLSMAEQMIDPFQSYVQDNQRCGDGGQTLPPLCGRAVWLKITRQRWLLVLSRWTNTKNSSPVVRLPVPRLATTVWHSVGN